MTPLNLTARFWRASIAIAILIGITACGEGETNLLNPGTTREIGAPPDTISGVLLSADRSYRPRIATGSLVALTIADQDQLTSQAYLRFDSDDLPDTNGVAIGNLGLRFLRGSGGALRLRASEIASDAPVWTEDDLPLDPLPVEEPFFVSDRSFAPAEGETLIVTDAVRIPASILKRWKTDPESNRGIALALEPTRTGLLRILSKEAVIDTAGNAVNPQLEILRNDGAPVLLAPVEDAYRLVDDSPPAAGNAAALLIEQSVPHEALFRFDLASTPLEKGGTVHRAEILLRTVPGSVAAGDSFVVGIYRNLSAWEESVEPDTVAREPLAIDIAIVKDDVDSLLFDFGPAVQRWLDGEENDGITLRILDEGTASSSGEIVSREAAEGAPQITIVYSPPPDPRWLSGRELP